MAKLYTWYEQRLPGWIFQIGIRNEDGDRFTIKLRADSDYISVDNSYNDAEDWTSVKEIKGPVVSEKISKGKPFVIKQIFSMVEAE